jgi:alpha-L-fucosidase
MKERARDCDANEHAGTRFLLPSAVVAIVMAVFAFAARGADTQTPGVPNILGAGGNAAGYDMAPETRPEVVAAALAAIPEKIPAGPFTNTWDSLQAHYKVPSWFSDAKFGIFMHWGLYDVPAHHNEWYKKFMYGPGLEWHTQNFGAPDVFGYKDFIPRFTVEHFDADEWAKLFKASGARYVIPTAQHHDNFSLWDSKFNPYNSMQMGPHRDLIGELAKAVRAQGLKFGVSNHGIEAFQFVNPSAKLMADLKAKQVDLYDPKWADFYLVADRSDAACQKFLVNWVERNVELIDKYQPDMLWFDNGVDIRYLDPLKLWVAAYYYNRAAAWGREVSISTKKAAYAPSGDNIKTIGSIIDFEKIGGRSPAGIRPGSWQVDEPIGSTWGYTTGMRISSADSIIGKLVDTASKNGNLLLNISPKADGTIPPEQQETLLGIGKWLSMNGEAIYGTHAWTKFSDDEGKRDRGGNIFFTVKDQNLYAIIVGKWPGAEISIKTLAGESGITSITMLGFSGELNFSQGGGGLVVRLPPSPPCPSAYVLKIAGLKMNAPDYTVSGNPE